MALPWETIDRVTTAEGPLELRRRGRDFLITIAGRLYLRFRTLGGIQQFRLQAERAHQRNTGLNAGMEADQ